MKYFCLWSISIVTEGMGRKLKFKLKSGLIMPPTLLSTRHWTGTNILNKNISRPSRHIWVESKLFHWKCNVQDECLITCCWLEEGSTVYSVTHHTSRRHTCCRSRSQSRVLTQHTTLFVASICLSASFTSLRTSYSDCLWLFLHLVSASFIVTLVTADSDLMVSVPKACGLGLFVLWGEAAPASCNVWFYETISEKIWC